MTEVAPPWLKRPIVSVLDLLAVVPSVVFGLWGVLVLAEPIGRFYDHVSNVLAPIPLIGKLFEGPVSGRSFFTAGLILAIMIIPIITSLTREVFDTTPVTEKEAAYGLGATRWEMIRAVRLLPQQGRAWWGRSPSGSGGRWARRSPPRWSSARTRRSPPSCSSPATRCRR